MILLRPLFLYLFMAFSPARPAAQHDCNALGAWVWHVELTAFNNHTSNANALSTHGVKRVYLKVSDGRADTVKWPEMVDESVPQLYHSFGLEVWGWSYNYPNNEDQQAQALYFAAKSGYDGYVVDVESQFDGKKLELNKLFAAFRRAHDRAKSEGLITDDFKIYCTTWGNPLDHNFSIRDIDPYVDGYMPQTYVEIWGRPYLDDLEFWVKAGTEEYKALGATKPIHHICATEKGIINAGEVNRFVSVAGPETSMWVVPGQNTNPDIWAVWLDIDWKKSFCTSTENIIAEIQDSKNQHLTYIYENPIELPRKSNITVHDTNGSLVSNKTETQSIDLSGLAQGYYVVMVYEGLVRRMVKFVII